MKLPLAVLVAFAAAHAAAQPDRTILARHSEDELKQVFLACDRGAATALLGAADAAACSLVYEELKERVFGGDFRRLVAWWKAQPRDRPPAARPVQPARD